MLKDQGLLSRLLVTYPESTMGSRLYKEEDLSIVNEFCAYFQRISQILRQPLPLADGKRNELQPRRLLLSSDAKRAFIEFHDCVELSLKKEFKPIKGLANKAPEHAARIAGILALVEDLSVSSISLEIMNRGISLMNY